MSVRGCAWANSAAPSLSAVHVMHCFLAVPRGKLSGTLQRILMNWQDNDVFLNPKGNHLLPVEREFPRKYLAHQSSSFLGTPVPRPQQPEDQRRLHWPQQSCRGERQYALVCNLGELFCLASKGSHFRTPPYLSQLRRF